MQSVWSEDIKIRRREPLAGDMEVTAVVIGAGLAGILTAYYLKQAGIRVVVLEADRIGSGQTKNTTAKITSQHNLIYDRLIRSFGRPMAEHYAMANEAAIGEYDRLILEKGIDCDFVRCPAYLYSRIETDLLKREAEAAESLGIKASYGTECELPLSVAGVTRFENQARFHPLKFLAKIAEEVEVYEQTKVLRVEDRRVETAGGTVTAEHIVFAAHYPFINVPGYYFARMYQERSYVVALEGAERPQGLYLGIDRDGLSFRTCGDLVLLGGESHRTGVNRKSRSNKEMNPGDSGHTEMNSESGTGAGCKYEVLRSRARELYPGCREASHWSAQDCITLDGLPYIGRFSRRKPFWYVATGFGKWGMTSAMVSARILTAMISGQDCPEGDIFSPQRHFTAQAAKGLAVHGAYTVKGLTKHLLPWGNKKIVPNCPHMGCRLEWNPEEESYDCPCHGSRFDGEGHLLDGPAQTDCRKRERG